MFFTSKFKREIKTQSTEQILSTLNELQSNLDGYIEMVNDLQKQGAETIRNFGAAYSKSASSFALNEISSNISKTQKQIKICKNELASRNIVLSNDELMFS